MKKLEKIIMVALVVAMVGIIVFWVAGFNDQMRLALGGFLAAGISSWIALIAIGLKSMRYRHIS